MHQPLAPSTPFARRLLPEGAPRPALSIVLVVTALLGILLPIILVANAPHIAPVARKVAHARPVQRVIPPVELPPVEPAVFVALAPQDARVYNATIPFSTAPLLPARPFRIVGDADSIARATDCLAAGVLYEAGDDSVGQRAVAQVILNRVRHPAFPKTICGVVFQGAERRTGCQFTFTCDGALARRYSEAAWARAQDVAASALAGRVEKAVGTATHYHTDWVVPYWSASLDKVSEVHTHLFFRWTGWWGTPPAFRGRYQAAEPVVAKLRGIAASHGGDVPAAEEGAAVPPTITVAADALPQPMTNEPDIFLLTLDPQLGGGDFAALAARTCGDRAYCKLMAWTDRADTPAALPADARQMGRMAFSYLRDRARNFDKAFWNCERYPRPDPSQCMKTQMTVSLTPRASARPETSPTRPAAVPDLSGVRRKTGTLAPPAAAPTPAATTGR